jgi:hypothetical protein
VLSEPLQSFFFAEVLMVRYLQDSIDGEFNSILASPQVYLNHLIRSRQHVRRNRDADLLRVREN